MMFKHPQRKWKRRVGRPTARRGLLAFIDPETLIPAHQRLPAIKSFANATRAESSPLFDRVHAGDGQRRHSNPHELPLRAELPICLYAAG